MKRLALILPLLLPLLNPALAGSIPKEEISADAKWLVHLEAAQFRATKVGGFVTSELLEKKLKLNQLVQQINSKFKLDIDPNKILDGINSITIYGTDYNSLQDHSVLLIRASPDLEKILVGFLAGMALAGTNAPLQVTQTQEGRLAFYAIQDTLLRGASRQGHRHWPHAPDHGKRRQSAGRQGARPGFRRGLRRLWRHEGGFLFPGSRRRF